MLTCYNGMTLSSWTMVCVWMLMSCIQAKVQYTLAFENINLRDEQKLRDEPKSRWKGHTLKWRVYDKVGRLAGMQSG